MRREVLVNVRRGEELLCVLRSEAKGGYWHVVAGGVEPGEEWIDAARRELREETGLEAEELASSGGFAYIREHWEAEPGLRVVVEAFLAEAPPGWEPVLNDEHVEYRWLPRDEAAELQFWPEPARLIRELP